VGTEATRVRRTTCCIAGGGPAGAVLALLLARKGVPVTLLGGATGDSSGAFRGDTIHASVMEIMEDLGLAESGCTSSAHQGPTHGLRHPSRGRHVSDYGRLWTKYPYIMVVPQARSWSSSPPRRPVPVLRAGHGGECSAAESRKGGVRGVRYGPTTPGTRSAPC